MWLFDGDEGGVGGTRGFNSLSEVKSDLSRSAALRSPLEAKSPSHNPIPFQQPKKKKRRIHFSAKTNLSPPVPPHSSNTKGRNTLLLKNPPPLPHLFSKPIHNIKSLKPKPITVKFSRLYSYTHTMYSPITNKNLPPTLFNCRKYLCQDHCILTKENHEFKRRVILLQIEFRTIN